MSNSLRASRNNSKYLQTFVPPTKLLCPVHNQPVIKVQIQTKTLICSKCQQVTVPLNLEEERIKAAALFKQFVKEFKKTNEQLEKTIAMFKQPGIPEVKRTIKLTLSHVQQIIDKKLEEEIEKGNEAIKREVDAELEQWVFLNNEEVIVSSLEDLNKMMNYKEIFEEARRKIEKTKLRVKQDIIKQVKKAVRQYYEKNLIV